MDEKRRPAPTCRGGPWNKEETWFRVGLFLFLFLFGHRSFASLERRYVCRVAPNVWAGNAADALYVVAPSALVKQILTRRAARVLSPRPGRPTDLAHTFAAADRLGAWESWTRDFAFRQLTNVVNGFPLCYIACNPATWSRRGRASTGKAEAKPSGVESGAGPGCGSRKGELAA